jgi:hypothetical protein
MDWDEMSNLYRGPQAILDSDWLIFFKSSPLKLFSHMNQNFVGSILGPL